MGEPFPVRRSNRQGDPISFPLFVLSEEPFLIQIRRNPEIKGFKPPNVEENKLEAFADDTTCIVQEPICRGIKEILGCFEKYSKVSGAKLNLDKCKGLALGCLAGEGEFEIEAIKFQECVEILGINFGCNIGTKNWPEITQNIKVTLNHPFP